MEEKSSYSIFSKTFNKILDKNTSYLYQAISKLHVIKNHSEYFSKFKKKNNFLEKIIQKLYFFLRENKMFYSHKSLTSCECLIISNIIKYKKIGVFKDNYFGNLEKQLNELNLKSIKVYRNLSSHTSNYLIKDKVFKENILLSKRSNLTKELFYFFILIKSYFLIKFISKNNFLKKNLSIFDFFTIPGNLRIGDQLLKILEITKPKILIFTFEGHSWERILINKVKKKFPNIIVAGYQFTSLIKEQNSIYRRTKKDFAPDIILSSGNESKKILFENNSDFKIKVLGSAKEINTLKKNHIKIKKTKINILFVPEGLLEENYKMLHFCIESAKKNKNLEFNFRFHPLIDPEKFLIDFRFKNLLKEISNLQISKNELDYDIKLNDFVVFRGSSIAFDACLNDKIPLYLDIDEFNCNPLFKVLPKCLHINQISDFKNLVDVSSLKYNKEELKSYCLNYFQKLKPEVILTLINE